VTHRALLLILLVALGLRLANAVYLPWQGGDRVISDMLGYDRAALALLHQQPLAVHTVERYLFHPLGSDTYHPPGFYYFLAGVYLAFGHSYLAVRIVQAFLGVLTCLFVYLLGRDLFGRYAGLFASAFAALYPPLVFYCAVLLTETLSTCLLAGATWLLLRSSRTPVHHQAGTLLAAGLLFGMAGLTRSVLLIALPAGLAWRLWIDGSWTRVRETITIAVALCLPVLAVIAPIAWRNYQLHGELVPISTNGGVNFFLGHGGSPAWKNEIRGVPSDYHEGDPLVGISGRSAAEEEAYFYALGWQYIRTHPLSLVRDLGDKLRSMYWDSDYWPATETQADLLRRVDRVAWQVLALPLALLSPLLLTQSSRRAALLPALLLASSLVIPGVFWAQTRFRVPFLPFAIVLAAAAALRLARGLTGAVSSPLQYKEQHP